jgi:hypothetical protein
MTAPWWAAFGPAQAEVSCGTGTHTLRWADGTLAAADHPDAEGELVLAALGGDTTPCLDLVRSWGRHSDDLSVLAIGPRSAADQLTITTETLDELGLQVGGGPGAVSIGGTVARIRRSTSSYSFGSSGGGFISARSAPMRARAGGASHMTARRAAVSRLMRMHHLGQGPDGDNDGTDLLQLLALGEPFQRRLSGAVAHAWSAEGEQADRASRAPAALTAALTGRLAPAAADWLDVDAANVEARIHDGAGWGELHVTQSGGARHLRARLPVSWLATVWAPGFAVVGGHLVVHVLDAAWPTARVLALRAPGAKPTELSIRADTAHWSVTAS